MKTITISVNVPDSLYDHEIPEFIANCEKLASPDWATLFWGIEDVKEVATLTRRECQALLAMIEKHHDRLVGVNYDVIDEYVEVMYRQADDES